jgi:hypothetical protein
LEPSEKQLFFGVPFFDSFRERALNNLVREREDLLRREFCP